MKTLDLDQNRPPKTRGPRPRCSTIPYSQLFVSYFVYILRTSSNTLYIGQTNNLEKRIKEHQSKSPKSAKYTKYFGSVELVYSESFESRSGAMKREVELKKWTKNKKELLVANGLKSL